MSFDLYLMRRFLSAFAVVLGVVFALVLLIDTLDVLGAVRDERIGPLDAIWLSSLRVPDIIVTVFPLIILISSMVFCLGMAKNSEFVIARAIGRPMITTLIAPAFIVLVSAVIVILSLGPYSARMQNQFAAAKASFSNDIESRLQVTDTGLWLRESNDDFVTVINAESSGQNGSRLNNLTVFQFDDTGRLVRRLEAPLGFISNEELILTSVKVWSFEALLNNPELNAETRGVLRLSTNLTAQQIIEGQPAPKTLFLWDMPATIAALEQAGTSSLEHRIHFLAQATTPVFYLAMFLIGAMFTLQSSRLGSAGVAVIGAVSLGFFLFFFQRTSQTFGEAGELPIVVATLSPPFAAFLGALAWLLRHEDG
ncbi:MAG: LptF/LptG family permease [Pseudomonadota bacterium]